jgi:drug/metabolite transporter (DMT)-like permease
MQQPAAASSLESVVSGAGSSAAPRRTSRQSTGYAMVAGAYVVFGSIGALVNYASAPESMLLVLRFGIASIVLTILFVRRRTFAQFVQPGVPWRLLLMGVVDAASQLCFFVALRETGVATGMFLFYTGPIFVAVLAPLLARQKTDRVVWPALGLGFVGLAVILTPGIFGSSTRFSVLGIVCGVAAAILWALFMLIVKTLTTSVSSTGIVTVECWLDTLFLLPLALVQTLGSGYSITSKDLISGSVLAILCTVIAYVVFVEGVGLIRVQHSSILGYLEPVSAPIYALVLLGERPDVWTVVGGVLILAAGALVVVFGSADEEPEQMDEIGRSTIEVEGVETGVRASP